MRSSLLFLRSFFIAEPIEDYLEAHCSEVHSSSFEDISFRVKFAFTKLRV